MIALDGEVADDCKLHIVGAAKASETDLDTLLAVLLGLLGSRFAFAFSLLVAACSMLYALPAGECASCKIDHSSGTGQVQCAMQAGRLNIACMQSNRTWR